MVFYGLTCDCCTTIGEWHNSLTEASQALATVEREAPEYRNHFSVVSVDFSTGKLTVYGTCAGCAEGAQPRKRYATLTARMAGAGHSSDAPRSTRRPARNSVEAGAAKADSYVVALPLRCEECGRRWDEPTVRWRVYFTNDEPPQPATYCPECAAREFGD